MPTLKHIAILSGFSVTTVSRALAGHGDVNPDTRQRIRGIADEIGYQPNHSARQLQGQRTYALGLIMPPPAHTADDDFFSLLLKGIISKAASHGYDVVASASRSDSIELDTYKRFVAGKRVDGLIVARTYRDDARIRYLQSMNFPFIVHGRRTPGEISDFPYIDVDSQLGVRMLTEHLIEQGHQQIGIILPLPSLAFTPYRLAGYQQALSDHALPYHEHYCTHGDLTNVGGRQAAEQLLSSAPGLTAIIGCNDWMALGAQAVVRERGYTVGQDFAVVGYDNIPAAAHAAPPLTTIHQPIYQIGEQLTQQLVRLIESEPQAEFPQLLIKPELVIRGSSGASS